MDDVENALERLENIRTVEPIASALRTVSLGTWQAALKRRTNVHRYGEELLSLLPALVSHLPRSARRWRRVDAPASRILMLVIGSERGLCGRFNAIAVERAMGYLQENASTRAVIELIALGSKVARGLAREGRPPDDARALSVTALPSPEMADGLAQGWLARYETGEIDAVDLIYNRYRGAGRYVPTVTRLIPPTFPPEEDRAPEEVWPPPIIETDPARLHARIVAQWTAVRLYGVLLDSAAAEHSARYQLMDGATKNAERLIEELTLIVQTARRQAITQEMQELAAGAGLIGSPD
jgi:F-type H+-transporting ATPase subunit gamma